MRLLPDAHINSAAIGCSGAIVRKVTPNKVSGRGEHADLTKITELERDFGPFERPSQSF